MNLDNCTSVDVGLKEKINTYKTMKLSQFIETWLKTFKKDSIKPPTYARLESSLNALRNFPIADMPIGQITAFEIQQYVNELTNAGYGLTTIKKQMRIVTAPLKQAAAMHFISADPSAGVKLPSEDKVKKAKKITRPYSEAEQAALWNIINFSDKPGVLAIGLMLETGLRCGEALALRWNYVDIQRKRLQVVATIINSADKKRSYLQESPKTVSSRRTVPLTPTAIRILERLRRGNNTQWVFLNHGERLSYEALRYQTQQACKNANVEYLGEHVFRHTFATNCYYRNVDVKVLSKLLGHADVNITYNIYISLRGDGFDEMYAALTG